VSSDRGYAPIHDYGLIGDCRTAALVSQGGSIDWWCAPRFDSGSCFGRLLDHERGGHCSIVPADEGATAFQRYVDHTLVLETIFRGPAGEACLRDCLALPDGGPDAEPVEPGPPTGAVVAAATTSLPETEGGERNWDYRYAWIRDSTFAARCLADLGHDVEADRFRRFIERSAAGHVGDLRIAYGVGGERRLIESEVDLEGYRGARPVRIGNGAAEQTQLDALGMLVDLTWRWHRRGHSPDDDHWRFVVDVVDRAAEAWKEPDRGLWEWRDEPKHFVHSKVMCWAAVDRGLRLAKECLRKAPERRWGRARDEIREAVEREGFDAERGVFVQAFGSKSADGALLLLPLVDFVAFDDPRMLATVDFVRDELSWNGLLRRYDGDDGLPGREGAFLACSFWLAECLAYQGRHQEAREAFDAALATASELGIFSEEHDPERDEAYGNVPQALTHLSHISAALALSGSPPDTAR
jgi:GH15 family glucan-1,4-alpha-glucosidase